MHHESMARFVPKLTNTNCRPISETFLAEYGDDKNLDLFVIPYF